jgi:hypothetical protein
MDISQESLVEQSLQIVRHLYARGQIDLSPGGLQRLFSAKGDQATKR